MLYHICQKLLTSSSPHHSVKITFVQVDPETNDILDAGDVLDAVDNSNVVDALADQMGTTVMEEFRANQTCESKLIGRTGYSMEFRMLVL